MRGMPSGGNLMGSHFYYKTKDLAESWASRLRNAGYESKITLARDHPLSSLIVGYIVEITSDNRGYDRSDPRGTGFERGSWE